MSEHYKFDDLKISIVAEEGLEEDLNIVDLRWLLGERCGESGTLLARNFVDAFFETLPKSIESLRERTMTITQDSYSFDPLTAAELVQLEGNSYYEELRASLDAEITPCEGRSQSVMEMHFYFSEL